MSLADGMAWEKEHGDTTAQSIRKWSEKQANVAEWLAEHTPIWLIDFYKYGHVRQYPTGIKRVVVNMTPRSTRVTDAKGIISFGLQRFIKKTLIAKFQRYFFDRPWNVIEAEYRRVALATLGDKDPYLGHIRRLWSHGKLPLDIYAVPEGTEVPFGVPSMVIVNNEDWAFWLPNYFETTMSSNIWHPSTSASTALRYLKIFTKYAKLAGETDLSFTHWQGHDFSYRGLEGDEAAMMSGMGHLLSFSGTDTVPAILDAEKFYHADLTVGGSVPATEHSVMCAGSQEGELETFHRLVSIVYPDGIVSIVSDTWDLWKVLTEIIPKLKDEILARNGKIVIRPDSGDPVKILLGDPEVPNSHPAFLGALKLLAQALGVTKGPGGFLINKGGLIYGDSITPDRAEAILSGAIKMGFSPYNFVFGIGSYTYQYVTRDTYNFAFKATAIQWEDGRWEAIFKDPVTDNAHKKSHRGIPLTTWDTSGNLVVRETLIREELDSPSTAFRKVFNGDLLVDDTFDAIRNRVRSLVNQS